MRVGTSDARNNTVQTTEKNKKSLCGGKSEKKIVDAEFINALQHCGFKGIHTLFKGGIRVVSNENEIVKTFLNPNPI